MKENFAFEDIWTECVAKNNKKFLFLDGLARPIVIVCETTYVSILIAVNCTAHTSQIIHQSRYVIVGNRRYTTCPLDANLISANDKSHLLRLLY
jgi:hypothetical protein